MPAHLQKKYIYMCACVMHLNVSFISLVYGFCIVRSCFVARTRQTCGPCYGVVAEA